MHINIKPFIVNLQVYVDREDSPESVMSSLDAVVLQHRVAEQEGTIIDLRERIAEMEKAMITTGTEM